MAQHGGLPGKSFAEIWESAYPGVSFDSICAASPPPSPEGQLAGSSSPDRRPNLLLVDEAQVGFSQENELWDILKDAQKTDKPGVRIIIVSSWGSDVIQQLGPETHVRTPGDWEDGSAVISLR